MIGLRLDRDTALHRIPAGYKLTAVAAAAIALIWLEDLRILAIICAAVPFLYFMLGKDGWRHWKVCRPILPFLVVIPVFHYFGDTLNDGLVAIMKMFILFMLAGLMTLTTRISEMRRATEPILWPLRLFGIRPTEISLGIALLFRFTPYFLEIWHTLDESWKSRLGGRFKWRLIGPLIVSSVRTSNQVTEALQARGGSSGMAVFNNDTKTKPKQ